MGKAIEADWVMVTRCRDCAWYETGISETARGMCSVYSDTGAGFGGDMYPLPDDFCSYGERRNEKRAGKVEDHQ